MPVNIPRLKRIEPAEQVKGNRFNYKVSDQSDIILKNMSNISLTAEEGIELYQEIRRDKLEQISNENEREYVTWNTKKLNDLKKIEGNPTEAYASYELEEKEKVEEILNKYPDIDRNVKEAVKLNLQKVQGSQRLHVLKQQGFQQSVYENNLHESVLNIKKNDLVLSAANVRKENSHTFFSFDQKINEIVNEITKRGLKIGTVTKDKNGKIKYTKIAEQKIAKELSDGVTNSVKILIDTGYVEEANELKEKYNRYIDPLNQSKLEKKFATVNIKTKAYQIIGQLTGKTEEDQIEKIEKIEDPELKSEVLKIKNTDDKRRKSILDRKSTVNYDRLANHVINRMNSKEPYYGISELEEDPIYKQTWDNITKPKEKKAILELVEAPKESKPESEAKIQNLFFGNDENYKIETITPSEFNTYLRGLDKKTRNRYSSLFTNLRLETASEQRANYKRAEKLLSDQLYRLNYLKKDDYGFWTKRSEKKLIDARNELIDYLSDQYGTFSEKELKDFVLEFSASKIKNDEIFMPTPRRVFDEDKYVDQEKSLTIEERRRLRTKYKETFGEYPDLNSKKYRNFILGNRWKK